ncbi:MAG: porin family protein [Candidatus Cryptobacteroides sp.]
MRHGYFLAAVIAALLLGGSVAQARTAGDRWTYEFHAGINIGGVVPMPFPVEIRDIKGYNPLFLPYLEADASYWFNRRWGISSGVRFEYKGMKTVAQVKNYGMKIIGDDGSQMSGNWTGTVQTRVKSSFVSIPVVAVFRLSNTLDLKAGGFASFIMEKDFGGKVYDGYLREGSPVGDKIQFSDGAVAAYDFSSDIAAVHYGAQIGADWRLGQHLKLHGTLTWSLSDIFKDSFETITFDMYPVYAAVGIGYAF